MRLMKTLQQRTQEALDAGHSVGDLARAAGKTSAAVSQWLSGNTKTLKADSAVGLELLTGWSATWWATGKGNRDAMRPDNGGVAHDMSQARPIVPVPKVAWENLDMGLKPDQPFELEVIDGAFGADIPPGCIMRMDPNRPPRAGWPVLVMDKAGKHYLRDYQQGPGGRWQAVARARGFAPLDSTEDELQVIAVMKGVDWP